MGSSFVRSAAVVAALTSTGGAAAADGFDKPIDKKVIALPADPANPSAKPKRSCFSYPGFVVKEIDLGEKGADELSIAPGAAPGCMAKLPGELVVKGEDWAGYFLGAKGPFVFFNADDGLNGGLPFAVFSARPGKKLFEDSREGEAFTSIGIISGALVLQYRRVWLAPCSLFADPKGCWKTVVAKTMLPDAARPDCGKAYRAAMASTPKFANDIPKLRSVIAYNVQARYADGKLDLKPMAGPATCRVEE